MPADVLGNQIRERRKAAGMTQPEFAERIGVSKQQVMRYEVHGAQNMRVRRLVDICQVLECTPNELLEEGGE